MTTVEVQFHGPKIIPLESRVLYEFDVGRSRFDAVYVLCLQNFEGNYKFMIKDCFMEQLWYSSQTCDLSTVVLCSDSHVGQPSAASVHS